MAGDTRVTRAAAEDLDLSIHCVPQIGRLGHQFISGKGHKRANWTIVAVDAGACSLDYRCDKHGSDSYLLGQRSPTVRTILALNAVGTHTALEPL